MADDIPQIVVTPICDISGPNDDVKVLVSVKTPAGAARTPSDIVCVIDVSGSMGSEAKIQGASGASESYGLSLLDVAKHGVRTVVKTLHDQDRLSIVSFENVARVILPLTPMTADGQAQAEAKLGELHAGGGTNIWNGLHAGMEALREAARGGCIGHVVLLTDGQTTEREACVPRLKEYMGRYEGLPGTISTFGFGYGIDSPLLVELADIGDASYSFIPDAGFVGTVFVNTVSNLLCTMARETHLTLQPEDGCEVLGVMGGYTASPSSGGMLSVKIGTLQYEQSKDIVVRMKVRGDGPYLCVGGSYHAFAGSGGRVEMTASEDNLTGNPAEVEKHVLRSRFTEVINDCVALAKDRSEAALRTASGRIREFVDTFPAARDEKVSALLEDVNGQVTEAFSKTEFYWKWGVHFVPSLAFAHQLEQCNNFKDPGVQFYGGELFKRTQEAADDIFNQLPPPTPSVPPRPVSRGSAAPAARAPVSMAAFNDRYGG